MSKTVIVRREEGYKSATIQYDSPEYKLEICKVITDLEQNFKLYPEVMHEEESENKSFYSVEFSGDDYTCDHSCGEFIEKMMNKLDIRESLEEVL